MWPAFFPLINIYLVGRASGKNELATRVKRHRIDLCAVRSDVVRGRVLSGVPAKRKSQQRTLLIKQARYQHDEFAIVADGSEKTVVKRVPCHILFKRKAQLA